MASSFTNPYGSSRGPQKNTQLPGSDWFSSPLPAATVPTPKSSAPKTQGTPYQAYAQQGQAQSIPTQSQGTPYQAYAQPTLRPASQTVTGDWQGAYAAAPASQRPPPFQMGAAQTPWGQSMDPFAERDAFVNQLNQQRMQNQIAFNSGGMTNPAAGLTPGLDYQKAMQQAGLGGGAPSMSANYGDSMISRLNQAFGGQGDPFTFAQPQVAPYQPFVNQQGQQFQGTMSFAPGTSQAYQNQAYGNFANQQGYYQPQFTSPAPFEWRAGPSSQGTEWGMPLPARPPRPQPYDTSRFGDGPPQGQQPIPPSSQNTAWTIPPQHAAEFLKYQQSRGPRDMMYSPERDRREYEQWAENTGRTAPGSSYYPGGPSAPERPGQAQPIAPPSQGTPYQQPPSQPQYGTPPEFRGRGRTADWRDADRDGIDDRDQDGPGMPSYWGKPANPVARPGQDRLTRPPLQGTPYQQPANGDSRTDPGSGKTVTYKDGQWTWQPNPISGPQPYDTSRFGDGTPPNAVKPGAAEPIAPPSQGDPFAVKDVSSLPFYKELMVGDTVRKRDDGQYDVYDQSGAAIQRYNSSGNLTVTKKGGRSGQTMWLSTPEGQAEQAATLKRLEEQEAPRRDAAQKDADAKLARLGQLRNQQFAYVKNKKGGGYTPPSWDKEYQDLTRWALSQDTLSSVNDQQFTQIADWFPSTFGGNPNVIRRR